MDIKVRAGKRYETTNADFLIVIFKREKGKRVIEDIREVSRENLKELLKAIIKEVK